MKTKPELPSEFREDSSPELPGDESHEALLHEETLGWGENVDPSEWIFFPATRTKYESAARFLFSRHFSFRFTTRTRTSVPSSERRGRPRTRSKETLLPSRVTLKALRTPFL